MTLGGTTAALVVLAASIHRAKRLTWTDAS